MKIQPVASPHAIQTPPTTNNTAARERVIAMIQNQGSPQEHPVQNPTNVAPEEASVVTRAQSQHPETTEQSDNLTSVEDTPTPQPPKDEAQSRRFAQLARQERQLRIKAQQQENAFKAREEALKAREAEITSKSTQFNENDYIPKSRVKQDALQVLTDAGVSYDELTQQILNQQPTDPRILRTIQSLQEEIKSLKAATEETRNTYTAQQEESRKSAIRQIEVDVKGLVRNDPNFETIKATNSIRDVVELITETYDKDGVLMTVEEAAQEVENYLIDEAMKLTRIGKIKQRLGQTAQSQQAGAKTPANQQTQQTKSQMKTLTNANSSSRKLSAKERAILAFKGELKG
jgi:hypothetical protein